VKRRNFILTAIAAFVTPWQSIRSLVDSPDRFPVSVDSRGGFIVPVDIAESALFMMAVKHKGVLHGKRIKIDFSKCRSLTVEE